MSAVADDVMVADEPILTLQPKQDDLNILETSGKLTTDGEVVDGAANDAKEALVDAGDVPGASHNSDDSCVATPSGNTFAARTSTEVLSTGKLVDDTEPQAPFLHPIVSDNDNTIIIQTSEPPVNEKVDSPSVEASEEPTVFTMAMNEKPVTLAESTQEDANEAADAAILEITKVEVPATDDTETQPTSVDADTTIVDAPKASVDDGEPPINNSIGPESAVSETVEPSINGVGSTTGIEPSLSQETPICDPSIEMNTSTEVSDEVVTPAIEAQEIPAIAVERAVVEATSEPSEAEAGPTEVEVALTEELPMVTEPVASIGSTADTASEDKPIPVEAEPEAPSSLGEPEIVTGLEAIPIDSTTSEVVEEDNAAVTEPEPEPTPTTEAVESELAEELAAGVKAVPIDSTVNEAVVEEAIAAVAEPELKPTPTTDAAESEPTEETILEPTTGTAQSDSAGESAPVAEAIIATVDPAGTSGVDTEDLAVAAEDKADEEPKVTVGAEDQPAVSTEPDADVSVPEVVSAPAEAAIEPVQGPTQPEEIVITADMETEVPAETVLAAEAEPVAANDSIATEPAQVVVSDPEPVTTTDPVGPEPAAPASETTAALEPELAESDVVVDTFPIDVEPPSSNVSFVEDPEVGFGLADEGSQTPPVAEEIFVSVEDVPTAEEYPTLTVEVVVAPAEEDVLVIEEPSSPAPVEEDAVVERPSAPALVERDVHIVEEPSEPTPVEEDTLIVEESSVPAPAEDTPEHTPIVQEPSAPTPVEEDITVVEEDVPTVEEPSSSAPTPIVEEPSAPAPVEDDIWIVEEPSVPMPVEEDFPVIEELSASAPVEEDAPVVEKPSTPAPVEEDIPDVEEPSTPAPVEEDIPVIEKPSAPAAVDEDIPLVEEPATALDEELSAAGVLSTLAPPEESTSGVEEITPVSEAALITPADSVLATSSVEETAIVAEEPAENDTPVAEPSVLVEELAPAESEASAIKKVVTEEPLLTNEELSADTTVEPAAPEDELVVISQVQIGEGPTDTDTIYSEVDESAKVSAPPTAAVETSSGIEEIDVVEQELAAITALSVVTDIERPKSPWTPSYSVTTQGSSISVEEPASTCEDEDDIVPIYARTPEIIVDEATAIIPEIAAHVEVSGQSQGDIDVVVQSVEEQITLGEVEEAHLQAPWTPSYSVTVQGHVAQSDEGLDELEQLPPSAAQSVEAEGVEGHPVSFTQEVPVASEVSSSTEVDADSYAVFSETLNDTVGHAIPDAVVEVEVSQHVPSEQVTTTAEAGPSLAIPPEPAVVEEEEIDLGSFIVEDESEGVSEPTEEHSRSPWTPSYSVIGVEPAFALENQVVVSESEFVEHGSFITETQPTSAVEDTPEAKSELLTPVDDPMGERPKSPWTPSYSVTKQGPSEDSEELDDLEQLPGPVTNIHALATEEEPISPVLITETRASVDEHVMAEGAPAAQETPQTFPILDERSQKFSKKPSLSAVDELNATNLIDASESTTLRINIPAANEDGRKRLESTTSSRFFPGGWFSSSPKVPEEGRTSLDIAAGEFVHQASVENTPTTALPSAVEEDREKKSRWCTIM